MKTHLVIGLMSVASIFVSTIASADEGEVEGDACRTSYEGAQVSMMKSAEGKSDLLKAREDLRTCLRSNCKDWIVADCSRWLSEVESRIPTVVFSARDTAGRDITDARVTTEAGAPIVEALDGRSVETNPGAYVYVFVRPDGTRREERVIVREGEKVQIVRATFDAPPEFAVEPRATTTMTPSAEPGAHPLKMLGYGAGGLGIAGLAVGSVFGLMAVSAKSSGNCDASGICDPGTRDEAYPYATVSTIGFVTGAVLVAGGVLMVLLSPSSAKKAALAPRPSSLAVTW